MTKTSFAELRAACALLFLLLLSPHARAEDGTFAAGGYHYPSAPASEWALPDALRELSGFATDRHGRLFGHNDEIAIIHELDYARGRIVKSFGLGNPPIAGDFEGIAFVDERIALTDSDGTLFLAPEGDPGTTVAFERVVTGIGARCEVEGIEYAVEDRLVYFACKNPRTPALADRITVIAWSLEQRREISERTLSIPVDRFPALPGKGKLRPSDVAIAPESGDLVLTAAKRRALLTVARDGTRVHAIRVPDSKPMQQIEAIAFGADGTLLLGSEGNKRGRMRVYRPAH